MSKNLEKTYNPKEIEPKLYEKWCENKYFHAEVDRSKKPFTTVMPPPNITGKLHMGHAFDNTLQDILIRYKRMQGYNALWIPGTDHAAIATEVKVTEQLKAEGIDKKELGREKFLERTWQWKDEYAGTIEGQLKNSVFPVTGIENASRWMRDAPKQLRKYSSNFMRKDTFIKDPESLTGVRYVRQRFPMQRLITKSRQDISGISNIQL